MDKTNFFCKIVLVFNLAKISPLLIRSIKFDHLTRVFSPPYYSTCPVCSAHLITCPAVCSAHLITCPVCSAHLTTTIDLTCVFSKGCTFQPSLSLPPTLPLSLVESKNGKPGQQHIYSF